MAKQKRRSLRNTKVRERTLTYDGQSVLGYRRGAATGNRRRTTTLTLEAEDLQGLARLISAGEVLLQMTHPVVARLKAAMTRMGLPAPKGL